jgi:polyribonucleotide nucleotidyltransferase
VVNVTKFGAFVNILPGRDGLVHISKLGRGKRINRVEDVLDLGDEVTVRVDDIDPNGKVSLTPIGPEFEAPAGDGTEAPSAGSSSGVPATVSFEDAFESEARQVYGDLGPGEAPSGNDRPSGGERRGDRDRDRRGGRRRR